MSNASPSRIQPIDTSVDVNTPEQVTFSYRLAGPAQRAMAYLVDLLVRAAIVGTVAAIAVMGETVGDEGLGGMSTGLMMLTLFGVEWGYYVLSEVLTSGQSIGKRMLNQRVVRVNGLPLRFSDSLLRNLLRAADFLPAAYALGLLVMGFDRNFRRLGDLVAGTLVVSEQRQRLVGELRLDPPPQPAEFHGIPTSPNLSTEDLDALELFLRQKERLSELREDELADMVAPLYAKRMQLRYRSASRFLALLYLRATQTRGSS